MGFGFLLGLIFPRILIEMGFDEKKSRSWIPLVSLPFLSFLGYILYPFMINGSFQMVPVQLFYGGEMFWIAIFLLVGGIVNQVYYLLIEQKGMPKMPKVHLRRKVKKRVEERPEEEHKEGTEEKESEEPKTKIEMQEKLVKEFHEKRVHE